MTAHERAPCIRNVAGRLAEIEGVVAVALGGSWARGEAHPDSEADLGIYYPGDDPPNIEALRALARGPQA